MTVKEKVLSRFILSDVQKKYVASLPLKRLDSRSYWVSIGISIFIFFGLILGGCLTVSGRNAGDILLSVSAIAFLGVVVNFLQWKMFQGIIDDSMPYLRNLSNDGNSSYELLERRLISQLEDLENESPVLVKIGLSCWSFFIVGCFVSGIPSHMIGGGILACMIGCIYFFKSKSNDLMNLAINILVSNPWLNDEIEPNYPMAKWHDDRLRMSLELLRENWTGVR